MARFRLDLPHARPLLDHQDGVIARRQLFELGAQPHDVVRLLRRRELAVAFPGVYVVHTGPLTQRQREWVAILTAWPAALTGASALPELSSGTVDLVVGSGRKLTLPPGARVRRSTTLDEDVLWHLSPPRIRSEHAVIDVMSRRVAAGDVAGAFNALSEVTHSRRTTPQRILDALERRTRVRGRAIIGQMLADVRDGARFVLEREYLNRVERAHGLPRGNRQPTSRATGRRTDADVRYDDYAFIVELDGAAYHRGPQRDADATRDLAELAVAERATVRLTYGLVFGHPCQTAAWIAMILQRRGWDGALRRCVRCPGALRKA